jgi:hypothetical protein
VRSEKDLTERLIWATRGRHWGFRFLLTGGLPDPLQMYERSFAGLEGESTACRSAAGRIALRFPDPLGRTDASGRVIPHDFVVSDGLGGGVASVDDGLRQIWPLVAEAYSRFWDAERPPTQTEVRDSASDDRAGGSARPAGTP